MTFEEAVEVMDRIDKFEKYLDQRDRRVGRLALHLRKQIDKRVKDEADKAILQNGVDAIIGHISSKDYEVTVDDGGYYNTIDIVDSVLNCMLTFNEAPIEEEWYYLYIKFMLGIWHLAEVDDNMIDEFVIKVNKLK